jgi:hypothetical protein
MKRSERRTEKSTRPVAVTRWSPVSYCTVLCSVTPRTSGSGAGDGVSDDGVSDDGVSDDGVSDDGVSDDGVSGILPLDGLVFVVRHHTGLRAARLVPTLPTL